jgi:Putative bacterial sensory transduction regulator
MTNSTAIAVLSSWLTDNGVEYERVDTDGTTTFVAVLPGEHKQRITVALSVGMHALTINAFVARHPDEHVDAVHQWLLERNRRMYAVAFAIDQLGDIYLAGKVDHRHLDAEEIDRIMGAVVEYADSSFNTILELGFATAIAKEWAWRIKAGEPTDNLAAFAHLAPRDAE